MLVCGYECECRATPGCDTVRYLRIFATGPAAYDQGDEDGVRGDEDDDDDWDEDEDEDEECDIETSGDRSSSPSGTTDAAPGMGGATATWTFTWAARRRQVTAGRCACDYYGGGLVAIDRGDGSDCWCQNDCQCREDVGDIEDADRVATRGRRAARWPTSADRRWALPPRSKGLDREDAPRDYTAAEK